MARIREMVLLCRPTCWAISVTPSTGLSMENASSTRSPCRSADVVPRPLSPAWSPPPRKRPLVSFESVIGAVLSGGPVGTGSATLNGRASCPSGRVTRSWSGTEDVVFRAEREPGDVLGACLGDDEDVMFTISAGAGLVLRDHDHGLHGDHHARLEYGVNVLAQLQAGLPAVIVAQHAERVPVPEGAVGQQPLGLVDFI